MKQTQVGIIGMGTVGTGVARILLEHGTEITQRTGAALNLARVHLHSPDKKRDVELPTGVATTSLDDIYNDDSISVVALTVGGIEPEREIMKRLLASGKAVVSANKAILAMHGKEMFDYAREHGQSIAFEAAVCGGIPIIEALQHGLSSNRVESIAAIVNGTANFVLTQMAQHGAPYDDTLKLAQEKGYAEADPTMDVDGTDSAHKLAILAHLAYGVDVDLNNIPTYGIQEIDSADMRHAKELGYTLKLLAVARMDEGQLELHVSPTLVRDNQPLANVHGAFNAARVVGDAVGETFFYGQGAGRMPTASAVVADLIDTALGRAKATFDAMCLWSGNGRKIPMRLHADVRSRYYLRLTVVDQPGVLGQITTILGKHGISISSVIQHEASETSNCASLVIMTHQSRTGAVELALGEIDQLENVTARSVKYRVND